MADSDVKVTQLLIDWSDGDKTALEKLMPAVYTELHRLASSYMRRERRGHTLQTTALVNEAYLRLVDQKRVNWQNRAQFFGVAAQTMRRILVDHARRRHAEKRGGGEESLPFDEAIGPTDEQPVNLVVLDDALKSLEALDSRQARIVEMKYFLDMTIEAIADATKISPATVKREWAVAKAWLTRELDRRGDET